ncbi:MAG: response regulator [Anaerolineae bacterium]
MSGELILYVDDDRFNRVLVSRVLKSSGYVMEEAETGKGGLEKAQQLKPDLILMDINLPDLDGYQCTDRIRNMPDIADTPIVALTANSMVGDREKALEAGCDGYISKPVDVDELPREVARQLQEAATRAAQGLPRSAAGEYAEKKRKQTGQLRGTGALRRTPADEEEQQAPQAVEQAKPADEKKPAATKAAPAKKSGALDKAKARSLATTTSPLDKAKKKASSGISPLDKAKARLRSGNSPLDKAKASSPLNKSDKKDEEKDDDKPAGG